MRANEIFGIILLSLTIAFLITVCIVIVILDKKEKKNKIAAEKRELNLRITNIERELEKQKGYFEARLFLEKFKWEDIKNVKLRKQTQKMIEAHEKSTSPTIYYTYEQAYIDRAEAIMNAIKKDAEITRYTEKEDKVKRSIKK